MVSAGGDILSNIVLVLTDPNESIFFPLSTAPPPAIFGALLLAG